MIWHNTGCYSIVYRCLSYMRTRCSDHLPCANGGRYCEEDLTGSTLGAGRFIIQMMATSAGPSVPIAMDAVEVHQFPSMEMASPLGKVVRV